MFYDQGCVGRVELGPIPQEVADRLASIPGEWLEFDTPTGSVVVRHVEPTSAKHLPTIAFELIRIFSEVPAEFHNRIPGGDLFVHTEDERGQLVRIRVETGGTIHFQWAHPDFQRALRRPYAGGSSFPSTPRFNASTARFRFEARLPKPLRWPCRTWPIPTTAFIRRGIVWPVHQVEPQWSLAWPR